MWEVFLENVGSHTIFILKEKITAHGLKAYVGSNGRS